MKQFLTLALALISFPSFSQKPFTLEDAIIGGYSTFRLKSPSQLSWVPGEEMFCWVTQDTANPALVKKALLAKDTLTICSLNDLKANAPLSELKRFPRITWTSSNTFRFMYKTNMMGYNTSTRKAQVLFGMPENGENLDIYDDKNFAYTIDNNLFVWSQGNEYQVTNDADPAILNGQAVHRFEFGISKGIFWSNKGESVAFYRKDESMVSDYPLANYTTKPASSNIIKYPMAGMASHQVTIGVWNSNTKKTVFLKTGEPKDQYLTNIAWSPNDKSIYVAILNRDQNEMKLVEYDPLSGEKVRTLFTEKHDKYVQPLHPMEFIGNSGDNFIWQSERDGYNNLYLYNKKGKVIKQLTTHKAPITEVLRVHGEQYITYILADNNGLDRTIYRLNLATGKAEKVSKESGVHNAKANSSGEYFIDYYTSLSTRLDINVIDASGKKALKLISNANPYKKHKVRLPEIGTIETNDGVKLNTRIFKPYDFDPSKKYKALLYVYNGPGVQLITNSWMAGGSPWMAYQANKGYIVYTVDGRGSENRGRDFEQKIFRNLGEFEVVDQLAATEQIMNLDYVDRKKMAVHGWSYGGFMTTSLMLKAPGIFQVGVAGGPVIDWKYYEIMYTERYMDLPEQNTAGYAKASLLDKVDNLKGDLLIIHGADDDVVVPQHSIDLLKQSVDKGVQIDFFMYPGHKHNVRGKDRVHLMEKVLNYIDEKLE